MSRKPKIQTAMHRPALVRRRFRHDNPTCLDLFSGFGGMTQGAEDAGFLAITAANHKAYKIEIHEANHPHVEHWIADLVDQDSPAYHSVRDLPYADLLLAGVSCVNHSQANTKKAYAGGMSLFDLDDPDFEERVTRSERDRATANCVLHYADQHHPRMILVECTTELTSWGPAVPGKRKVGDGTTFRWWLKQFDHLGYDHRILYLNSMFFGVPQSRDRLYIAFWDRKLPAPDLDHRPVAWCGRCDDHVEAVWTWKTGVPPTGSVRYGKQYNYRCPSCRSEVIPAATPSLHALDLSDLGTRIGEMKLKTIKDKKTGDVYEAPLARATLARAERCRQRFAEFPAVLMPAKAERGSERHPWQPMSTQTSQQETAILSTGALIAAAGNTFEHPGSTCRTRDLSEPIPTQTGTNTQALLTPPVALAVDNFQGAPRGADEALPTQGGSETMALISARVLPNRTNATSRGAGEPMETVVGGAGSGGLSVLSSGVVPFRQNTIPTTHAEAMPTFTAEQIPGLITAAGRVQNNGSIDEAKYRAYPLDNPLGTVVGSANQQGLLFSGWYKQNGSEGTETAAHPVADPLGTLTSRDTTALLNAQWREALADLKLEDCYFRMMREHEIGRGCGFDVDFADHKGTFVVWGSARDQVDGFGNAVSPPVGSWICRRLRAIYHGEVAA
ncbi:DNA cytosine methyltransferase [Nocardioides sp. SLBN-35]|uniref:DNA cytosine methyltransferase n=1 Tax=Nocardioides sp. SLBN-35 TaxID=2768445 RepID=UPI001168DA01|nr:DNA cytosine methyltransferase [Nocardioides sp. SLBN-35]TQK68256.1 C-5 cytosine-specific DNA methylase [Nocardioides sp. SLBN-35]